MTPGFTVRPSVSCTSSRAIQSMSLDFVNNNIRCPRNADNTTAGSSLIGVFFPSKVLLATIIFPGIFAASASSFFCACLRSSIRSRRARFSCLARSLASRICVLGSFFFTGATFCNSERRKTPCRPFTLYLGAPRVPLMILLILYTVFVQWASCPR